MTDPIQLSPPLGIHDAPGAPRRWRPLLAGAIVLGVAVRTWAATQWPANFQSDEAVFGLMARHILAGDFTPTLYGPAYLGSIESIIAAGFIFLFGPSVMAFRLATLLLFAAFFILHALFTSRYFGYPVAFVSLLFLALPGFHVLEWTYQPVGAYGAIFVIGTLMLIVALRDLSEPRQRVIRAGTIGILAGLGMWANNTTILYLAVLGLVAFQGSPEWRAIRDRLSGFAERVLLIPLAEWLPVAVVGLAGLGVLTFFSSGCRPEGLYLTIGSLARTMLIVVALGMGISALALSRRRAGLGLQLASLMIGFAVGYAPLLYPWMTKGTPPYWAVYPSCPEGAAGRAKLLVKEILPALWGIPTVDQLKAMGGPSLLAWIAVLGLSVGALGMLLWWNRVTIWRIFAFIPSESHTRPVSVILLLFAVPNLVSILAANTVDLYSIRHALMTVQASAIIFAVFAVWLSAKLPRVGMAVTAFWLLFGGISNLMYADTHWLVKFTRYEKADIAQLERFLEDSNIKYGYADYWGAYTLDYLLEEEAIIAPYNGLERYPPYARAAASAPKLAFVFPTTNAPKPTGMMSDLKSFLADADNPVGEGSAFRIIRDRLQWLEVSQFERVAAWDVWIVTEQ